MIQVLLPLGCTLLLAAPQERPEGERFGRSVLALHDVDGDGTRDFAVGAPTAHGARGYSGRVLVLSGTTREVLQVWRGEEARTLFGDTLRAAGDVDGDGVGDALVGYELGDRTEVRSGVDGALLNAFDRPASEVHAFGDLDGNGGADLLLAGERLEVRSGRDGAFLASHEYTRGGGAFHAAGDLDGDGFVDGVLLSDRSELLLSGHGDESGPTWEPYAYAHRTQLADRWPAAFEARSAVEILGAAPAGDLDGDGAPDLVLRTRVDKESELWGLSLVEPAPRFVLTGSAMTRDHGVGYALQCAGDLNGDGHDDLLVAEPVTSFQVAARLVSGKDGATLWRAEWGDGGALSGVSFALVEDADGDGVADFLVGRCDWIWHGIVIRSGQLRALSGASGEVLWRLGVAAPSKGADDVEEGR